MSNCLDNKPAPTPFSTDLNAINHVISIPEAVTMVENFNAVRETMLAGGYSNNTLPVYETFNLQPVHDILTQPTAIGFRIYLGMNNEQKVVFILTGVDGDGQDIIQRQQADPMGTYVSEENSILVEEMGQRWP